MQTIEGPNILGQYLAGQQAGQEAKKRSFLTQNGAALMQGDQNVLAQYAQMDPEGAMGIMQRQQEQAYRNQQMELQRERMAMDREQFGLTQQRYAAEDQRADQRLGMERERLDLTRQQNQLESGRADRRLEIDEDRLSIARQTARQAAAEHALTLDAAEREAQAAKIEKGLKGAAHFYNAGDQAGYEAFLRQNQLDPEQFPYEDFPAHAAQFEGAIEALRDFEEADSGGEEPAAVQGLRIRAQEAGLEPGTPEYQDFMLSGGKTETSRVIMGPDGRPIYAEGAAATGGSFTEGQSKDNVYSTRARGALEVLEPVADTLSSRNERVAEMVPFGLARGTQSDDFQVAQQAGTEFLQAILRKDTGAAITQDETESYGRVYLPQPGDGAAVLEAKRQARIRAVNALESGMSPSQMLARDRALIRSAEEAGVEPEASGGSRSSRAPQSVSEPGTTGAREPRIIDLDGEQYRVERID